MSLYIDTSIIVAALTTEARSIQARHWLREHRADGLSISDWVITEVSTALSIKVRIGALTPATQAASLQQLARMQRGLVRLLTVEPSFFREAARIADRHETGVRAGDALHLAICAHFGRALCTFDKDQANAGRSIGIRTTLV